MVKIIKIKLYYGWVIVILSVIITLIIAGTRFSFGVFVIPLSNEFDFLRTETSSIYSLYMLLCIFFTIMGGWVFDKYGPKIEINPLFPNRTNVQFMNVLDRSNIQIEIWERGAGYTLASGSSSTAAAAIAHRLDMCDSDITVRMPGGKIRIQFGDDFAAIMTGPVTKVCDGNIDDEMFEDCIYI